MNSRPSVYDSIRPHHLVALYAVAWCGWSSLSLALLARRRRRHRHRLVSANATDQITTTSSSSSSTSFVTRALVAWTSRLSTHGIVWIQRGWIPDAIIRWGIRMQLCHHLHQLADTSDVSSELATKRAIVQELQRMPIAIATDEANDQHYEVPTAFYDLCLGPAKKYSSGYWPTSTTTFAESEQHMLQLYCERANVVDGMSIVDLGCGWGSLTLYIALHYPNCKITAISNSNSQREYILATARERGYNVNNINIITCNVSDDQGALSVVQNNDLVMTVEMLEHMKNYQNLLTKVAGFLKPKGKLFVHIFTHKQYAYHFDKGWMSDNFFTGGTMPSDDLLLYFAHDFAVEQHWRVDGTHYEKTSNAWLQKMDHHWKNGSLSSILAQAYGPGREREWYINWRLFFLACAELWGYDNGQEWIVSHYLFERR